MLLLYRSLVSLKCRLILDFCNCDLVRLLSENEDKDQATFEAHFKTELFQALGKAIVEENLLATPVDIKIIKPFAGLSSRI